MKVKQVKATLNSIQHIIGSLQFGIGLMNENDVVTEEMLREMENIINEEFKRLREGLEPITVLNHLKTRKYEKEIVK